MDEGDHTVRWVLTGGNLGQRKAVAVALHAEAKKLEDGEKFDLAAQKWEKFLKVSRGH